MIITVTIRDHTSSVDDEPFDREILIADQDSDRHFTVHFNSGGFALREHGWGSTQTVRLNWDELDFLVSEVQRWKHARQEWKESRRNAPESADDLPF